MNVYLYAIFTYVLMAAIALALVAIIVLLNKLLNRKKKEVNKND